VRKVIAVANQKGGVGKTFLVFHLAHFLREKGHRCLLVDLDPQGNLSLALQFSRQLDLGCEVARIFEEERFFAHEVEEGLLLVPSDIGLARYEASAGGVGVYFKLRRALERYLSEEGADFVLLDCPPSLGLFSLSAFVAAQALLVPLRPEMFSVSGLGDLLRVAEEVRENINAALEVTGLVLNAVQERTRVTRETLRELSEHVSLPVLAKFPHSIRAEEALREGRPVWALAPESPLARSLREGLARVLEALEARPSP